MQALLNHPGWDRLCKYWYAQIEGRKNEIVFTPIAQQAGQFEQEFRKGECSGLFTAISMPKTLIEETELMLKEMNQNERGNADGN